MYNNPYNFYPYFNPGNTLLTSGVARNVARPSLFNAIRGIKWGTVLTNTQKTLNVINQAIPVYYQMKPIVNNIRSFGKIMTAITEPDSKEVTTPTQVVKENPKKEDPNGLPTFFID